MQCSRSLEENAARGYVAEVIQVGTSVDSLQPGDYVMTFGSHGVATRFKIAAGNAVRVPESWTLEYAATVPLAYATALFCLKYFARLQKNDAVLIVDACSSAGIAAVRVCHSVGVKVSSNGPRAREPWLNKTASPSCSQQEPSHVSCCRTGRFGRCGRDL